MPTGLQLESSWSNPENEYRILATISSVKQFTALVYLGANKYHIQGISLIQCSASYVRLPLKRYQRSVQCVADKDGAKIPLRYVNIVITKYKTWHYICVKPHCEPKLRLYVILNLSHTSQKTRSIFITKKQLLLCREIIAVYFENISKQIRTKCVKKSENLFLSGRHIQLIVGFENLL